MKFTAGETYTVRVAQAVLTIKIEDASKGETVSARIERVDSGEGYEAGQIRDFARNDLAETD